MTTPTDTDVDPAIPDDLADALRRAAAAVPPADLHPTGPALRLRARRRRHRLMAAAGGAAAAVTAVVALNLASGADKPPVAAVDPSELPSTAGIHTPLALPQGKGELLPDGTERPLPTAQPDDIVWRYVRLADGRVVTLSSRPGDAEETSGSALALPDQPSVLGVFDVDGNLLGERDIRRDDRAAQLIGDVDGQVVLMYTSNTISGNGGTEIVAIDPDTFEEDQLGIDDGPQPIATATAGRLVITHQQSTLAVGGPADEVECWADVFDLPEGDPRRIDLPCYLIWGAQLSPDGRHLALVHDLAHASIEGDGQTTLQIVDVESGEIVAGTPLPNPCREHPEGTCSWEQRQAITWTSDTAVAAVVDVSFMLNTGGNGPPSEQPEQRHIITVDVP